MDYIKIIITVILAVSGWLIGNYFANKRSTIQRKKEITIKHLINAYRILTNEISHREETEERSRKLEDILSDIQLFGSKTQVELAQNLANTVAQGGIFELDPLINSLRNDLRKELELTEIKGNVTWLRFNDKDK